MLLKLLFYQITYVKILFMSFKWVSDDGKGNLNVKLGEISNSHN